MADEKQSRKLSFLKRRVVKNAGVAFAILAVLGVAMYLADGFAGDQQKQSRAIENDMRQKRTRLADLENKFNIYEGAFFSYKELYERLTRGYYTLDVNRARVALDVLRKRHRVMDMSVSISSQNMFGKETQKYVGFEPIYREVTLGFSALTDAHVYALIRSIEDNFPGFIRLKMLELRKADDYSATLREAVRAGETPSLVRANVVFLWIGIEEVETQESGRVS